jgi:hypothetical protein
MRSGYCDIIEHIDDCVFAGIEPDCEDGSSDVRELPCFTTVQEKLGLEFAESVFEFGRHVDVEDFRILLVVLRMQLLASALARSRGVTFGR